MTDLTWGPWAIWCGECLNSQNTTSYTWNPPIQACLRQRSPLAGRAAAVLLFSAFSSTLALPTAGASFLSSSSVDLLQILCFSSCPRHMAISVHIPAQASTTHSMSTLDSHHPPASQPHSTPAAPGSHFRPRPYLRRWWCLAAWNALPPRIRIAHSFIILP